jgi:hypothetical protein
MIIILHYGMGHVYQLFLPVMLPLFSLPEYSQSPDELRRVSFISAITHAQIFAAWRCINPNLTNPLCDLIAICNKSLKKAHFQVKIA